MDRDGSWSGPAIAGAEKRNHRRGGPADETREDKKTETSKRPLGGVSEVLVALLEELLHEEWF